MSNNKWILILGTSLIAILIVVAIPLAFVAGRFYQNQPPALVVTTEIPPIVITPTEVEPSPTPLPTSTPEPTATLLPSSTPEPTATPLPTFTPPPTFTPTATPLPCNWAQFVGDVTVPDNTPFTPGASFIKTWRVRNVGSCTWTSDYSLVFVNGNAMTDKVSYAVPKTVYPGETVDLSVKLTAPSQSGDYRGSWMLRSAAGEYFGLGTNQDIAFWVRINVIRANPDFDYDFAASYCEAEWRNGKGSLLACPGKRVDTNGFVLLLESPTLENRSENEPTLWTQPNPTRGGEISGYYPEYKVRNGDHFRAWVGCLDDSRGCAVMFRLDYQIDGKPNVKNLGSWREIYDGDISRVDVDLSELAGKEVHFILVVEVTGGDPDNANAFWFVPRIER